MKALLLMTLLAGLWTMSTVAHAQAYPCSGPGPGEVVVGQTQGGQGIAPIPLCQRVDQPQSPPPPQWESRWGAITTDVQHGVVGSSTGELNASAAEQRAITDCKTKGGKDCQVQISFSNGCGVMLVGKKTFNLNMGETEAIATQKAMQTCSANDTDCQVYFSICSPPARLQ